uniref:AIG1-type G domain-containing protein n=1 Tax=Hippocampus comes TaxID=109280 RepID=A0A3Q2Y1A1_HIPCM
MDKALSQGSKRVDLEFVLDNRLVSLHRADIPPDATDEIVSQAVNGCFRSCKDGISAFLVLIRGGNYTAGQMRLVKLLQVHFGAEAFRYLVVVSLEDAKMTNTLDDTLLELIDACDGRYCRLTTSEARDKVNALVSMVDYMLVESGGAGGYSQAMLGEAERRSAEDTSMRMLKQKVREAEAKMRAFGQMTAQREERRAKEVEELRAKHAEERRKEAAERRSYQAKKETLEEAVISHRATLHLHNKPDDEDTNKLSVVLLGLSGSGKTSALNLISARAGNHYPDSGSDDEIPQPTLACTRREVCVAGRRLVFVDTPELWDGDGVENPEKVKDCLALALPGPHVFLLVLQVGRFTQCESLMPAHLQKVFGRDASERAMVLFVHLDQGLKRSQRVHEYVAGAHVALQELVRRCGSRYYEVSLATPHKGPSYPQVRDLLAGIEKLAASHGGRGHIVKRFSAQELQDRKKAMEDNKDAPWEDNFLLAEE